MEIKRKMLLASQTPICMLDNWARIVNLSNVDIALRNGDSDALVFILNKCREADDLLLYMSYKPCFFQLLIIVSYSSLPKQFFTPQLLNCVMKSSQALESLLNNLVLIIPDYPCLFCDFGFLYTFFALRAKCAASALQVHTFLLFIICRECLVQSEFIGAEMLLQVQSWACALDESSTDVFETAFAELNQSAFYYFVLAATKLAVNGQFVSMDRALEINPAYCDSYISALNVHFPEQAAYIYSGATVQRIQFVYRFLEYLREGNSAAQIMQVNFQHIVSVLSSEVYCSSEAMEIVARLQSYGLGEYVAEVQRIIDEIE